MILQICLQCLIFAVCVNGDGFISDSSNIQLLSIFGKDGEDSYILSKSWEYIVNTSKVYEGDISKKCLKYLMQFSDATSIFINCTITNSRPLHYCQKCVAQYLSVNNMYYQINNDTSAKSNNCREQILRADTIQVVHLTFNFVNSIWQTSNCDRCFNITEVNHTQKYVPTAEVQKLLHKINITMQCFEDFAGLPHNNSNFNSSVCSNCEFLYRDANKMYENANIHKMLCSDIIDSMNYTRLAWAGTYNCSVAVRDKGGVWAITAIVFILPLIFYLSLFYYDKHHAHIPVSLSSQEFTEAT